MERKSVFSLSLLVATSLANADPSITWEIKGSSFAINANNPENLSYNCVANYSLLYSQYGTPGRQHFNTSFRVQARSNGNVVLNSTSWAASTLNYDQVNVQCAPVASSYFPPPKHHSSQAPAFSCPSGLTKIGNMYGESSSGSGAYLKDRSVIFPAGIELDKSYRQSQRVQTAGGGAHSKWDGLKGIPDGVYIYATGGHYWAVGDSGAPGMQYNKDGSPKSLTLGTYCGPAGWPGPGCNVNVFVCAKLK